MAIDRFLIAPFDEGLETDLKPWLLPDKAFATLNNAYVFRGRVRKRFGSRYTGVDALTSRLRIPLVDGFGAPILTDGGGNAAGTVPGAIFKIGQQFSIDDEIYTVSIAVGNMLSTGVGVGTFNTGTGAFTFAGAPALQQVYYYPAEPVMGLTQYRSGSVNNQPAYAFDTQFAYKFVNSWDFAGPTAGSQWHGDNSDYFWSTVWMSIENQKALFVSNFQVANPDGAIVPATDDPIWTYNDVTATWAPFVKITIPNVGIPLHSSYISTAKIILPFKDRLVLLNTIEATWDAGLAAFRNVHYRNRIRFSHNGSPFDVNAFYEPNTVDNLGVVADGGDFLDAPTDEEIISAEYIKDRLIVYFERSTWELTYTHNQVLPFLFQKINTELGSVGTYSTVPFDKFVLTIGESGVHACNGTNVQRIDDKIPDEIWKFKDRLLATSRTAGVRDYFTEMVYWAFCPCDNAPTSTFPTRVLVYNYKTDTWSYNDDCFTTLGYFEQAAGRTWLSTPYSWNACNWSWDSGVMQTGFRIPIGGNPQGFISILDSEHPKNASVLQITNMALTAGGQLRLTIIDHTLEYGDYIKINDPTGVSGLDGDITFVDDVIDANNIILGPVVGGWTGLYSGGATIQRVSNIQILSKQWNPYVGQARNFQLVKIDFAVLKTTAGAITVDYYPTGTTLSLIDESKASGSFLGDVDLVNVLETSPYALKPLEAVQDRLWHPVYFQGEGAFVQIFLSFTDSQLRNEDISEAPFELEGLILHTRPTSTLLE